MTLRDALARSEVFGDLDARQLDLMSRLFVERPTRSHQVLVRQGDRVPAVGDALFIVVDGTVALHIDGVPDTHDGAVAWLSSGDVFGVASIVDQGLRSATFIVGQAGAVGCLARRTLDALVHSDLDLAARVEFALARQLARDLRVFDANLRFAAVGRQADHEADR